MTEYETIEPTQEYFLEFMKANGFTESHIEANRAHHGGRLFLSPAVVIGSIRGACGSIDPVSGDLKRSERDEVEQRLRDGFEESLSERIEAELEDSRDYREERLSDQIEESMRAAFEDSLADKVDAALEAGREEREERLAVDLEDRMRREFEFLLDESIEHILEVETQL